MSKNKIMACKIVNLLLQTVSKTLSKDNSRTNGPIVEAIFDFEKITPKTDHR